MDRRELVSNAARGLAAATLPRAVGGRARRRTVRLCLCGDVMTGRGIDQALPHPGDPRLQEDYVRSALDYVQLAEQRSGPIARPLDYAAVWGAALGHWRQLAPDVRVMNLETSVTVSDAFAAKGINYRMHPANIPCLQAARPDVLALANNHVLDFGRGGLAETLRTLHAAGLRTAGAGRDRAEAEAPAAVAVGAGRVLVYAVAAGDSGAPPDWAAGPGAPGVALTRLGEAAGRALGERIGRERQPGDLAVVSIHWGSNWGYEVPEAHRRFAHALIDTGQAAMVFGHSSHHPRPIEVYRDRLILYGCGDFLNDYEGISGHEAFRSELVAMYLADLDPGSGRLVRLSLVPLRIRRFRLQEQLPAERAWLAATLSRVSRPFGVDLAQAPSGSLEARWATPPP